MRLIDADELRYEQEERYRKIDKGRAFAGASIPIVDGVRLDEIEQSINLVENAQTIDAVPVKDVFALSQKLEKEKQYFKSGFDTLLAENKKLKRERDAAVADLKFSKDCKTCKNRDTNPLDPPCRWCGIRGRNYEWRGVKEV